MSDDRTICQSPTACKKTTAIPTWKFDAIRAAILQVVPADSSGVVAKELPALVTAVLSAEVRERLASVSWHTTTVRLHMEVLGDLRRAAKKRPVQLLRTTGA